MCKSIFITGTPCTGKTTVSEVLASRLNCKLVKINDLVKLLPLYKIVVENNYEFEISQSMKSTSPTE